MLDNTAPEPIQLRPYQLEGIDRIREGLRRHSAVLFQAPTGAGKTQVVASMMQAAVKKCGRPWFVMNRDFLVDQTSKTLTRVGVDHAFIAAGRRWNPWADAQVCAIDTLRSRLDRVPADRLPTVVFVDEAHHSCAGTWLKVLRWLIDKGCKVVGVSATPERLDGKGLDEFYQHLVLGPSVEWLIGQGYLSRYLAFAPTMPDLTGIGTRGGDFKADELAAKMDKDTLVGNMVGHYKTLAPGKRAVYFAVSIAHSQHIAAEFRRAGVSAVHIDGSSTWDERRSAARGMAIGEVDVICNVGLLGEGYDLAAQAGRDVTIEAVGLARPTQSLAMYMQQVGRALRPKDQPAIILDHAGNVMRHGLPDDEREWSLEGKKKTKPKAGAPTAPTPRVCLNCFAQCRAGALKCTNCGAPFGGGDRVLGETEDELAPVDPVALRTMRRAQEAACQTLLDYIEVGRARGYEKPEAWARHVFEAKQRNGQRAPKWREEQAAGMRR